MGFFCDGGVGIVGSSHSLPAEDGTGTGGPLQAPRLTQRSTEMESHFHCEAALRTR
jgi:hypothetical protein